MSNLKTWQNYKEGLEIKWSFTFSYEDMNLFAQLSGDHNPLHSDTNFAKPKGYKSPLIYGLLLSSQTSRLIGEELPDNNCILTGISLDFLNPAFPNDKLFFNATLIHKSNSSFSLEFNCKISSDKKILTRGKVYAIWRI